MNGSRAIFERLGELYGYPGEGFEASCRAALAASAAHPDRITARLFAFIGDVTALATGDREELYTRTFDINPRASLEIGWQLFGESYDRGGLLVEMRGLLREVGLAEGTELPDHLMSVLPLFARLDEARAEALALEKLGPAVQKMLQGFGESDEPYRHLLAATLDYLAFAVGGVEKFRSDSQAEQPAAAAAGFDC